ncbi:MAG: hypothetical protein QNJ31_07335 [Candidatus Caenarcaniphilales bacterium]|nr:hypothetical protein [Candidatus Caenarcaniphilales bacterium]
MVNIFINNPNNYQGNDPIKNALNNLLGNNRSVSLDSLFKTNKSDTYVSAANKIQKQRGDNGEYIYSVEPTDEFVYNPNDGKLYLVRQTANGLVYEELPQDQDLLKLFFNATGTSIPPARDSQNLQQLLKPGDELVYDQDRDRLYIKRKDANGNIQEIDVDRQNGDLTPSSASNNNRSVPSTDVQKEVSRISSNNQVFDALGVPHGLRTSSTDVSGVAPGFGDQTGAFLNSSIYIEAGLYNQLQKTITIINYLNTQPSGTAPNPNFSYIAGRPPYGQDSPEGRKEQDKVFAALRTNIIAQLTRIAQQIRDAISGFRTQRDLAQSFKQTQDSNVKGWVDKAFGG